MAYQGRSDLPRSYIPTPAADLASTFHGHSGAPGGGLYPRVALPVRDTPGVPSASSVPTATFLPSGDVPIRVRVRQDLMITPMTTGHLPQIPHPRNGTRLDFDFERDFIAQAERELAASSASKSTQSGIQGQQGQQQDHQQEQQQQQQHGRGGTAQGFPGASSSSASGSQDPVLSELQQQLEVERSIGFEMRDSFSSALQDGPFLAQNGTLQPNAGLDRQNQLSVILDPAAAVYISMGCQSDAVHLALAIHNGTTETKVLDFCTAYGDLAEMGFLPEAIAGALAFYDNDRDRALAHLAPGL